MIKFFRKIRQSLLADSKFIKYVIYAIREIVIVVIGILIALQINNWDNENIQREKEVGYCTEIKTNLSIDLNNEIMPAINLLE